MKRALLATLWVGAVAAGVAIALQISGLLARPDAALARVLGLAPNEAASFANLLLVLLLGFAVAWTMLVVTEVSRRIALLALLLVELFAAAWLLSLTNIGFAPLPALIAVVLASALAAGMTATGSTRQRRAAARLFRGRLAQAGQDKLAEAKTLDLSQPLTREASLVFCEIANEADLVDELAAPECAQLTREFLDFASKRFLAESGYLHAADGEGVRVLFGFPNETERHATAASRAALAFCESFRAAREAKPDSLGKIDLRLGISSGTMVATVRDDVPGGEIVIAGEPLEIGRRLARANQIYGSQILLGPRTFSQAGKEILARPMDFLRNIEAHDRLEVYELLALAEKATPEQVALRDRFWTAVVYFRERRWNEAFAEFNRARNDNGEPDPPLQWYLRRLGPLCLNMASDPAPVAEPLAPLP